MGSTEHLDLDLAGLRFNDDGLAPAIVQDGRTGEVLMLGWMNRESLARTLESGEIWFYSRSRQELWHKGATSGDRLRLRWLRADCDADALLLGVEPLGEGACHVPGERSCFWQPVAGAAFDDGRSFDVLGELTRVLAERKATMPEGSYTTTLFRGGVDRAAQKVGEEAVEVVIAAKNHASEPGVALAGEVADLVYHLLVLAELVGLPADDVLAELGRRRGRPQTAS